MVAAVCAGAGGAPEREHERPDPPHCNKSEHGKHSISAMGFASLTIPWLQYNQPPLLMCVGNCAQNCFKSSLAEAEAYTDDAPDAPSVGLSQKKKGKNVT